MDTIQAPDFLAIGETLIKDTRRFAKVYCLQWFDNSFQNQGFTDAGFQAWPKRNEPDRRPGGAVLTDTTFLRKSLKVMEEGQSTIEFGTHVPYAAIHNNGGRVSAVQYVRGHHRTRKGRREQVQPFSRKLNFVMPQRKFIGESKMMMDGLNDWVLNEIQKRFNEL